MGGRYPSPLPPIGGSCLETDNKQSVSGQSSLPDPWPVLNDTERAFAEKFVGMGFPTPRVARAVQRLGTKDKEVRVEQKCTCIVISIIYYWSATQSAIYMYVRLILLSCSPSNRNFLWSRAH